MYQIEVRAISEQHDVLAHQVAREILQLPGGQLPSLAAIAASTTPLTIRTAQLYYLTGNLTPTQINLLTRQLLIDTVIQEATVSQAAPVSNTYHIVDFFFHPGVTDTLAESVLAGASMLGITTVEHIETGRRYILDKRLSDDEVRFITEALLYNPVIQNYVLHNPVIQNYVLHNPAIQNDVLHNPVGADLSRPSPIYRPSVGFPISNLHVKTQNPAPTYIPLSNMTDQQLLELSKTGL